MDQVGHANDSTRENTGNRKMKREKEWKEGSVSVAGQVDPELSGAYDIYGNEESAESKHYLPLK